MRSILIFVCLVGCFAPNYGQSTITKGESLKYSIVKVFLESHDQFHILIDNDIDIDHVHGDAETGVKMHMSHPDVAKLAQLGLRYEVVVEDYAKDYAKRQAKAAANLNRPKALRTAANFGYGSVGGFYTYNEIVAKLDEMTALFPNIATPKMDVGTSIEGRTIWALKISDNPNVDENEPVTYYDALHHAREPLSMAVTVNYMFWLLESYATDPAVQYIIDNRELYFIPVVNPDGYEYNRQTDPNGGGLWRKNRRGGYGVDLNRNYSYQFGFNNSCASSSTSSQTYKGPTAFSEPETQAVRDLVNQINPVIAFSSHATAGSYLMPYGYNSTPPEFSTYSEWASDFLSENNYPYGTTSQMLGYTSCGTTRDYLHSEGVYAWTPEIDGSDFWPAQSEIFDLVDENVYPLFYQAWISGDYANVQAHEVLGSLTPGMTGQFAVTVKNKGAGAASSNVQVELVPNTADVTTSGIQDYSVINARQKADNYANPFNITVSPNYAQASFMMDIIIYQDGVESDRETVEVFTGDKVDLFADDAESGAGNWSSSGNGIAWGVNTDDSYSGNNSFSDSNGSNSTTSTTNYFTLNNNISLTGTNNPVLDFFAKWSFEPGDYVNLQVSTNNGSSWSNLETFTSAEKWIQKSYNLAAYIPAGAVRFRFRMITDNSLNTDGFYFDDFTVSDYTCPNCPICPNVVSTFPATESFESGTGTWSSGVGDINWTNNSGGTPSSSTGPSSASNGNSYMYVESSDPNFSKSASIESPCFELVNSTSAEISFDYHMYGAAMGSLDLEASIDNGVTWIPVWSLSGEQGNSWNTQIIDLQPFLGEYTKFRFYAFTGNSYTSDMSIDNVRVDAVAPSCTAGDACDDNDVCTVGETFDSNCNCTGGTFQDSDNDGICDANDACDDNDPVLITGFPFDPNCNAASGLPDGNITLSITGGTAPYTFDWTSPSSNYFSTDQDIFDLSAGEYVVLVTDSNGCTNEEIFVLVEPDPIDAVLTIIDANCNGGSLVYGEILLTAVGGTGNYTYNWQGPTGPSVLQDITGAVPGLYAVTITDDNGCEYTNLAELTNAAIGQACEDNDPCTTGETYDANCGCTGGTLVDSDNDGVCDSNDLCPNFDDNLIGSACDDGDPCTTGETYDNNCACSGGSLVDADNDGVCDTVDQCPNFDDNLIGTACDDNDPCTTGETYDANCGCSGGSLLDADNDGICDVNDSCPNFDNNLIGAACDDNDPCTTGETYDDNCNCSGGTLADADNDGVCDTVDQCPNFDDSLIGTACDDNDPCTTGETYDANCGCSGGTTEDTDSDGICDAIDSCPELDNALIGTACDDGNPMTDGETYNQNCGCSGGTTVCDANLPVFIDFETDLGPWIQLSTDDLDWSRRSGSTPSSNTGPSGASNGNFYLYIEASSPNYPSKLGQIQTPCYDLTAATTAEFRFDSHMYGNNMGTLALEVSTDEGASWTTVWTKSGNQGNQWITEVVDLQNYLGQVINFRFSGLTGNSFRSDMSIDNIGILATMLDCNIGSSCDDNDPCTTNDMYNNNCNCEGTLLPDTDGDNICDAIDQCPNFNDNLIGTTCDDNDPCTTGETYDANCGCSGGQLQDTDNDGICDANDQCPNFDNNLIGNACNDNDPCTTNDVYTANCNCAGTPTLDSDNDGICDTNDQCPNFDDNLIGTACDDNNPCTAGETYDANCGCSGGTIMDADNDGVCDADDQCQGHDDNMDTDSNGIPDGCENCPEIDFNFNPPLVYDQNQDLGTFQVQDNGATVFMEQNSWKAVAINYTITPNTVISFDFKSTTEGEIHEVAFDNDLSLAASHRFVLYGNQGYNGNYPISKYTGSGQWEHFDIPLGQFFSGSFAYLVLTADDDGSGNGNSYYSNISIFEDMDGDFACDISACTVGATCDDGNDCTTGETFDTNCDCNGGTVAADSDNDGVCDQLDLCPNQDDNLIGTACDDNDPCTVGETYDNNCNCSGGSYTDNDNDGYCIGQDPDDNDACNPDPNNNNCSGCQVFDSNDFEGGFGLWNDGGNDVRKNDYGNYNTSGTNSVRIRDDSGQNSSLYSDALNLSSYANVDISFTFYPVSMELGEDFFLEVSNNGGSSYAIVEQWISGSDFTNDVRQSETVSINSNSLSSSTVFRFRCDASTNSDQIYLDDIIIETCGQSLVSNEENDQLVLRQQTQEEDIDIKLFPNPAVDVLNIQLKGAEIIDIDVISPFGELICEHRNIEAQEYEMNINELEGNQSYLLKIVTETGEIIIEKFIKM